jgi:formylglycine-generating enzyme required for sulfatase activity
LSRDYFINDARGQRHASEKELPLPVGGKDLAGIVIPGLEADQLLAHIALSQGHAYIQPAGNYDSLYHNDERLTDSAWLKSGDRIQIGDSVMSWEVQGDKVLIKVFKMSELHHPSPPVQPPPTRSPSENDAMPVHTEDIEHGSGSRRRRRIILIVVSFLLLAAVYLLMVTPLVIKVEPQAATITMKGFPPPLSLWDSWLVFPGRYIMRARHPGYYPLDEELDIKMGGTNDLSYELIELPGLLNIKTNPVVDFKLYVDDDDVDTVLNDEGMAEIKRGSHRLRIETERYLDHQQEFDIQGYGRQQQLDVSLQPGWAAISIFSQPVGAEVLVDGGLVGLTPLVTDILQGQHQITLKKQGFKSVSFMQSVEAGIAVRLQEIQLQPVDGQLTISSTPEGASVMVEGKYQGTTPVTVNLTANTEHTLLLSKAGYSTKQQRITLKPEQESAIEVKLNAVYGTVFLTTRPAGATVEIDGRKADISSGRLRLTTRLHTLTVSKPGYVTERLSITPRRDISQNVSISLKTAQQQAAQQKLSATPLVITTKAGQQLQLLKPEQSFTMGASRREAGRRANENKRLVKLQRPFYFARNEITNEEFRQFRPSHDSGRLDGAALNGDTQPVVNISWDDAARYCNWLSEKHGLAKAYTEKGGKMVAVKPMTIGYRLATEAEWAWVARMSAQQSEQRYPWQGGFPPVRKSGNFADASIADTLADVVPDYDDGFRGSAPVASFPAWPKGFHDLGGNVAEWVNDFYTVYPGEANRMVTDPLGPASGEHHTVRGSSWRHGNITELRLSFRDYSNKPRYDLGFRIARYAE